MKLENISNGKIIGIGEVTVLPGETKDIPEAYETSPILEVYKRNGFAKITASPNLLRNPRLRRLPQKRMLRRKRLRTQSTLGGPFGCP